MVSKDQQPIPLSEDKYIEIFKKSMEDWGNKMSHNEGGYQFGFVDLEGLDAKPYGTAY
jgi:hypothetical protein